MMYDKSFKTDQCIVNVNGKEIDIKELGDDINQLIEKGLILYILFV